MAKPSFKRAERVGDQIRMEVADILARRTKDPRVGMITVTGVDLSADLRLAKVYVTTLQEGREAHALEGLKSALGFIRAELGRRLALRYTPDLIFRQDKSGQYGNRMEKLLDSLHEKKDTPEGE